MKATDWKIDDDSQAFYESIGYLLNDGTFPLFKLRCVLNSSGNYSALLRGFDTGKVLRGFAKGTDLETAKETVLRYAKEYIAEIYIVLQKENENV